MEQSICRTCLAETDGSIFKTIFVSQKELTLVEMLNDSMGIKVTESDKISLKICDICTDQIINFYVFRETCLNSNKFLLRELEDNKFETDVEKSINTTIVSVDGFNKDMLNNEPTKASVTCALCPTIFSSSHLMMAHLYKVHSNLEYAKYECEFCKKQYHKIKNLHKHIKNVHESDAPKFICDHCGQSFKNHKCLTLHIRRHTGEKPYKCDFCDYRATQQTCVTVHMRTHTGERPYKCEICRKLFRTSSSRASHMRGHSDETPYECIICVKKFKLKKIYMEHMLIHNPDKYIECKYCGKKFARKDNLNTHIKQHTGEKPHVCIYCGKDFIQKHSWQTHLKNHHNK